MTEQEIAQLRSRITELEQGDADFARKSNILLDNILLNGEQIERNTQAIDGNTQAIAENTRDIDQLADRIGGLAQEISDLRQIVQLVAFTVSQTAESMTILRQTQREFVEQAVAENRRIWEYLLQQHPNGHGE